MNSFCFICCELRFGFHKVLGEVKWSLSRCLFLADWVPAFAGMTKSWVCGKIPAFAGMTAVLVKFQEESVSF